MKNGVIKHTRHNANSVSATLDSKLKFVRLYFINSIHARCASSHNVIDTESIWKFTVQRLNTRIIPISINKMKDQKEIFKNNEHSS